MDPTGPGTYATFNNTVFGNNIASEYNRSFYENAVFGNNNLSSYNTGATFMANNAVFGNDNFENIDESTVGHVANNIIIGNRQIFSNDNIKIMAEVTNNILIGTAVSMNGGGSLLNSIYLGRAAHTNLNCKAVYNQTVTTSGNRQVYVKPDGTVASVSSSLRYKNTVETITDAEVAKFESLQCASYEYNNYPGVVNFGCIAEDTHTKFPELCNYDDDGVPDSISYGNFPALQLAAHKKLRADYDALRADHADLKTENDALRADYTDLKTENDALRADHTAIRAETAAMNSRLASLEQAVAQLLSATAT